nr:hypothetical protein [Tanacetum cinerariifolium]
MIVYAYVSFFLFAGCHILCFVLKVDLTEGRYLISGASDASLAVYAIQRATEYDHHINVWDTNTTQVVMDFKMPGKAANKSVLKPVFQVSTIIYNTINNEDLWTTSR